MQNRPRPRQQAAKPIRQQARFDPNRGAAPPEMIDLIDPVWILKALGAVFAAAIVLGYLTLCIVFSRTQWQLVLHPSRSVTADPASLNLPFTEVHFAVDTAGRPQLDGWFIPSDLPSDPTVLVLHSGDDNLTRALPIARDLHQSRLNVLLFDYRGYGRSLGQHPTQTLMQADAESALAYLTASRGIPATSILVYGTGAGASLAVKLCSGHKELPALILESPSGDLQAAILHDSRTRLLPVRLLFHEDFPLAAPLQSLPTPKLLISFSPTPAPPPPIFRNAADPKTTVELPTSPSTSIAPSLRRFLDTYLPHPPATLNLNP